MKNLSLIIIGLILTPLISLSQNKLFLGAETGIIAAKYKLYDPGGKLKNPDIPSISWGFNISREINKQLSVESGFHGFTYYGGPNFKFSFFASAGNIMDVYQIPLVLKYEHPLIKKKLTAHVLFGYVNNINRSYLSHGEGEFTLTRSGDTGHIKYEEFENFHRYFPMLEAGLGMNVRLFEDLSLTFESRYQKGFQKVIEIDAIYQYNSEPPQVAYLISKGNNFQYTIGLKYPVSNIWQLRQTRKDTREDIKINYSKSIDRRFFIGIGAGPLWRLFKESNAEQIASNWGRHSFWEFKYADIFKGIYAGYKFNRISVEGAYYRQNYTNRIFYKNIGTGHGWLSGEYNVNEFGVRTKYHYQLPGIFYRMVITPSVGLSFLHSAVSDLYETNTYSNNYTPTKDTAYYFENYFRTHQNIITFNSGIGIEFYLHPNLILFIDGRLDLGVREFNRISANVWIKNQLTEGDIIFKGNSQRILLGMKIPFDFKKRQ